MRGAQAKAAPGRFNQVAIAPMLLLHLAAATKPQPFTLTLMRQVEKNFLFRGPEQTVLGMWDDAGLRLQMRLLAPSLPHDFHLVDLCLLNAVDDVPAEDIERRYFAHHPDKGRFVWWPTNGTKLDAFNVSVASRAAAVRAWRPNSSWIDPLPWWVDEIDELLHTPRADNRSTVVFIQRLNAVAPRAYQHRVSRVPRCIPRPTATPRCARPTSDLGRHSPRTLSSPRTLPSRSATTRPRHWPRPPRASWQTPC